MALGDCELSLEGLASEEEEAELEGEEDAFEREEGRRALTLLTEVGTEARDEARKSITASLLSVVANERSAS